MIDISNVTGFDWDDENKDNNFKNHQVTDFECEQVFFNEPILVFKDTKHSTIENRYYALGKTDRKRLLFIVFTIRDYKLRIISARDMNKKERKIYYEKT